MKTQSLFQSSAAVLFAIALLFPLHGQSQSVDASALCNDVTPANRAMAKSAGYDVDALCSGLAAQPQRTPAPQAAAIPDRREMAQEKVDDQIDPTAVVDVTATPPVKALKPFGYDLFAGSPNTFAPVTNVPVSPNYLLGPGDMLEVMFYGKTNSAFGLEINRDGTVNFPDLGPVGLAGLTFQEAKDMLQTRINAQMIGVQASISMGELRSMQIFVLGEAYKPGAYTVSSLSTITHALVVSGGVSDIASLRNIQLKRAGKTIASLDLYDLLMRGDTKNDIRLQPADVIFIPTVGDLVSVDGQVLRPAIYELKGGESVSDLITLAGGLGPKAYPNNAGIERIEGGGFLTALDLDLTNASDLQLLLKSGDGLNVSAIKDRMESTVSLAGHVYYPGNFSWKEDMRLSDLISGLDQFPPGLDLDYAILSREDPLTGELSALLINPGAVIAEPGSAADLALKSRDHVMLFGQDLPREEQLEPLLVELRSQRSFDNPAKLVEISGSVKFPGAYPLTESMDIKQIIKASGGLTESAYMGYVEVTREDLSDAELANVEIKTANLTELLSESAGSLNLQANDLVTIKVLPDYRERESVTLEGEVMFPGIYVISRGETLVQVINRAGGFTEYADIGAVLFTRDALRVKEAQNLLELKERMEQQLSAEELNDTENPLDASALARQKEILSKLADTKAVGRLVIPLKAILDQRENDIILTSGDKLIIPKFRQEVTVLGEVQRSASHLFRKKTKLKDYLEMSGGFTQAADKRGVYLIKSSGEVVIPRSGLFRFKSKSDKVEPGDTIVVPVDTNGPVKFIPLMAEVSRMIYELALGAAAINSFSSP
ncbi:Polysialic acid transport protein KpsD precursor [Gammaproteobacteria bacterium MOLA455]|nr:Polysialic acid transport protein KpsD precursor [Gammaproteobacteria bacterium MOLA455]